MIEIPESDKLTILFNERFERKQIFGLIEIIESLILLSDGSIIISQCVGDTSKSSE